MVRVLDHFVHLRSVLVPSRLYLQVPGAEPHRRINHILVGAELEREHKYQQARSKDYCQNSQDRTARVTPYIAPGEQVITHIQCLRFFRLVRVNKRSLRISPKLSSIYSSLV